MNDPIVLCLFIGALLVFLFFLIRGIISAILKNKLSQQPLLKEFCAVAARSMEKRIYRSQYASFCIKINKNRFSSIDIDSDIHNSHIYTCIKFERDMNINWLGGKFRIKVLAQVLSEGIIDSLKRTLPSTDPTDGSKYTIERQINYLEDPDNDYEVIIRYDIAE